MQLRIARHNPPLLHCEQLVLGQGETLLDELKVALEDPVVIGTVRRGDHQKERIGQISHSCYSRVASDMLVLRSDVVGVSLREWAEKGHVYRALPQDVMHLAVRTTRAVTAMTRL